MNELKKLYFLLIFIISFSANSQNIEFENEAVNFYLKEIHSKKIKVKATGILTDFTKYYNGGLIYRKYLIRKRRMTFDSLLDEKYLNEYKNLSNGLVKIKLGQLTEKDIEIPIEKPINKVKKLKFTKLRGGPIGFIRRFRNLILGDRYNLEFYRYQQFDEYFYVAISVTKKDLEFADDYYFKMDNEANVLDWCKGGWIQ